MKLLARIGLAFAVTACANAPPNRPGPVVAVPAATYVPASDPDDDLEIPAPEVATVEASPEAPAPTSPPRPATAQAKEAAKKAYQSALVHMKAGDYAAALP